MNAVSRKKDVQLTTELLGDRLKLNSPELVKAIYDVVTAQLQGEAARRTRLDAKATSLLSASGLAVTLTFAFGGTLADKADKFSPWIVAPYFLAVFFGLTSSLFAVWALLVRDTDVAFSEETIFSREVLAFADSQAEAEDDRRASLREYYRFLTVQTWQMHQNRCRLLEQKADLIRVGQVLYGLFVASLFFVCTVIVSGMTKGDGFWQSAATSTGSSEAAPANTGRGSAARRKQALSRCAGALASGGDSCADSGSSGSSGSATGSTGSSGSATGSSGSATGSSGSATGSSGSATGYSGSEKDVAH